MNTFVLAYWLGMIGQVLIRAPYSRQWKAAAKTEARVSITERLALGLLTLGGFVIPIIFIYSLTNWLTFADYHLPTWLGWGWVLAQVLLLQNWVAGPLGVLTFAVFYFMRVQGEEKMMLEKFGQTYKDYMPRTGAVVPKL